MTPLIFIPVIALFWESANTSNSIPILTSVTVSSLAGQQ